MNKPIDISTVILRTQRLTLRPWRETDLDDFYEYASVDGVGQMAGWPPHQSKDVSKKILSFFIDRKKTFALEYQGKVIGSLGIEEYDEEHYPELALQQGRELGYVVSKDYWGMGLAPEAVKAVLDYLFDAVKLDFVLVGYFDWNRQSARVVEKCGFRYIKTTRFETLNGTVENSVESILYRADRYQALKIPYMDIVLRDLRKEDLDDEIRWMNVETAWMKADTPWEDYPPVDEAQLRARMTEKLDSLPPEAMRSRLEIEKDGKHIGFVCGYFLDENYQPLDSGSTATGFWTLGIEICEPAYWGQGIGTKALSAFIDYYRRNGETTFLLETWSGNPRMVCCAQKLGFTVCQRKTGAYLVDGVSYDGLILKFHA